MTTATLTKPTTVPAADVQPHPDAIAAAKTFGDLTALDRCDFPFAPSNLPAGAADEAATSCGAQAFARVVFPDGNDLLACGHHIGQQTIGKKATGQTAARVALNREAILRSGAVIVSEYDTINAKPDASYVPS